jgi:hypothetical protein
MNDATRITYCFSAAIVSVTEEGGVLTVGFASTDETEYLLLQRDLNCGGSDDLGVYVELNDQINSAYSLVKQCVIAPTELIVLLAQPLLNSTRIVLDLDAIGDDNNFVSGLCKIFGDLNLLAIRP